MKSTETKNQPLEKVRTADSGLPARWVLIGGFLGSGKTTAASKFANYLQSKSLRVGVITNDHGQALVDATTLRSQGLEAEELEGGCFCRQPSRFAEIADNLITEAGLNVLVAEPAGTCGDVGSTVSYPLPSTTDKPFISAPLSVLVDPIRASRIFGLDGGPRFSDKILRVYRKQLEDADFIVINKIDLISEPKLETLSNVLKKNHPSAQIFHVSARTGEGLPEWFDCIMSRERKSRDRAHTDDELLAQGEAMLGWLNCSVHLSSVKYWESSGVLMELATTIQNILRAEGGELAQLKMAFTPDEDMDAIAALSLVRTDSAPEISHKLPEPAQSGELLLNLRAEADPELLHAAVNRALLILVDQHPQLFARLEHCEHFRPGKARQPETVGHLD